MLYLLLKVASAVGMGLVLKRADAHSLERLPLIRTNYAIAAIIGFFASVALGQSHVSGPSALLAAVTGILFVAGLLIWARAIRAAGLALSVVAMRTAVVIPIFAAVLIWHENPSMLEIVGSFAALVALALVLSDVAGPRPAKSRLDFTTKTPSHQEAVPPGVDNRHSSLVSEIAASDSKTEPSSVLSTHHSSLVSSSSRLWLVLLFLVEGLTMIPALVFRKELPLDDTLPFETVIFISAFFVTTLLYYLRKPRLSPEALRWGALLGAANFGNYLFLVMALTVLPGIAVYPLIAAGEVGLLAIAGVVLWKEKVGARSWLGIALVVIALVLIQLGRTARIPV